MTNLPAPDPWILRQLRVLAGYSLPEFADRTGLNKGRLSNLERGLPARSEEAARILAALREGPR